MSRTDKDAPYRVHVTRIGRERHDHRFGVCDFEPRPYVRGEAERIPGWGYRYPCRLEIGWRCSSQSLRFYSRTKLQGFYAGSFYDREATRLRKETGDIKKLHRAGEDIEFEDVWSRQHRHSAEWEVW